jgi:VanZ family protein
MILSPPLWDESQKSPFKDKSITIEIWVHPAAEPSDVGIGRMVTLYDGQKPDVLLLGQWKSHLIIQSRDYREVGLDGLLAPYTDQFITVTSGAGETSIYINGKHEKTYPNHKLLSAFTGTPFRLILGNSATGESHWTGYLSGLAIYNRTLTPDEVVRSYQDWMNKGNPSASVDNGCIALYPFDERKGTIVHNHTGNNNQLTIPEVFTPLRHIVLSPPWHDLRWDLSSIQDVTTNIVGFIPFGFFCAAFLCKVKRRGKSAIYLNAALIGLGFSLAIELLQVYIPTRYSQLTDVICNLTGTIIGIAVFYKTVFPTSVTTRGALRCEKL